MPSGVPSSDPASAARNIGHSSGWRRHKMKMVALTMPTDWIAKLKSLPSVADSPNSNTSMGNPTVPPPMGVDPATYEPAAMATAMPQCSASVCQ